ncbi:hypothetical protein MCEMRE193_00128 [Candidatus Nanopelagicaceae bacterium]
MSTKTLRKRIALVAVSALGAGLLSVVAVPSANAAGAGEISNITGSIGIVGALAGENTTQTATILSTGSLVVTAGGATGGYYVVSAGGVIVSATGTTTTGTISADQQKFTVASSNNTFTVTPTGAAGTTFTVTGYTSTAATTVNDVLTVTIASSSVAGVANPSESVVRWDSDNATAPTAAESVVNASTTFGNTLELYINVADAYGQDISLTTGSLVVTASSGAVLGTLAATGAAAAPTAANNTAVSSADPSALWVYLAELTSGAGWSGTVTVSYNGVTLATLAGKITGRPSTLSVTPYKAGKTAATNATAFLYTVKDAAGNGLAMESDSILMDTSSNTAVVTNAAGTGGLDAAYDGAYGDYVGTGSITCGVAGTSDVVLKYTNTNGTTIKSAKASFRCAGAAYEYSASFDKASYVQGEVATLTVTFKDSKGNLANSYDAVDTVTALASDISISAPMMTLVGVANSGASAGTTAKPGISGTRKYTFTVGTTSGLTEGSYNAVVHFPTIDVATSAAYKVTSGSTGVSNADVLKAIVSLIASINKQIAALQKALLKK